MSGRFTCWIMIQLFHSLSESEWEIEREVKCWSICSVKCWSICSFFLASFKLLENLYATCLDFLDNEPSHPLYTHFKSLMLIKTVEGWYRFISSLWFPALEKLVFRGILRSVLSPWNGSNDTNRFRFQFQQRSTTSRLPRPRRHYRFPSQHFTPPRYQFHRLALNQIPPSLLRYIHLHSFNRTDQ